MAGRERDILGRAVRTLAEQAAKADDLVDEATAAGGGSHQVTIHAKLLRLELLQVKADIEARARDVRPRLLGLRQGREVHWVEGHGISAGHWAHREPAPHGEPAV